MAVLGELSSNVKLLRAWSLYKRVVFSVWLYLLSSGVSINNDNYPDNARHLGLRLSVSLRETILFLAIILTLPTSNRLLVRNRVLVVMNSCCSNSVSHRLTEGVVLKWAFGR